MMILKEITRGLDTSAVKCIYHPCSSGQLEWSYRYCTERILLWKRNQSASSERHHFTNSGRELSCLKKTIYRIELTIMHTFQEEIGNKTTSLLLCKKTFFRPLFTKALKRNTLCYANYLLFKKDHPVTSS